MSCSICMNVFICIVHTIYTYILQNTLSLVLSTSIIVYIYNLHAYINSYKYVVLTSSRFPVRIHHKNMDCLHRIQISKKNKDVIDLIDNWISCSLNAAIEI